MSLYLNRVLKALNTPHPLQPIWQTFLSNIQAEALSFSIEKKLLSSLLKFECAANLAKKYSLHPQNTDYLLQLLASMDLLETYTNEINQITFYRVKEILKPYFDLKNPQYCADSLLFRHQIMQSVCKQLPDTLSSDFEIQSKSIESIELGWANAARTQIAQEQSAITIHIAELLSHLIDEFKSAQYFLDVGAGAGLISMHLAENFPQLECTLLEFPDVIDAIRPTLKKHPVHARINCLPANIQTINFEKQYDIIWCSSVLHFVDDYSSILEKLLNALSPNGILICCHSEIDSVQPNPLIHSYYLNMRMQGNYVPQKGDIYRALKQLGCEHIQLIENVQFPVAPLDVLIVRK